MFKFFKPFALAVFFMTIAIVSFVFAQDTTGIGIGILENEFFKQFVKIPGMKEMAPLIYPVLIGFIYRILQEFLKKIPTSWGPNGPKAFWTIAALLFGKSIIFYNAKTDSTLEGTQKILAEQKLFEGLKEHYDNHQTKS